MADIVTRYLRENQIILVAVLIFGLAWWTIVIYFVLQDHIAQLQHVKFLVTVGIDLSHTSCCYCINCLNFFYCKTVSSKTTLLHTTTFHIHHNQPRIDSEHSTHYFFPISDITAGWVLLTKIVRLCVCVCVWMYVYILQVSFIWLMYDIIMSLICVSWIYNFLKLHFIDFWVVVLFLNQPFWILSFAFL